MNDPRETSYEPTTAGSHDAGQLAERPDLDRDAALPHAGREHDHDLTTTGVDADAALDEAVDDGLHHGHHHDHTHEHGGPHDHADHEHEHDLTTTGVDVDAALDRAVEHEI